MPDVVPPGVQPGVDPTAAITPSTQAPAPTRTPSPAAGAQSTTTPGSSPVSTKLQIAAKAAPTLDPRTTVAVAQSATDAYDAATKASTVEAFAWATKVAKALAGVSTQEQLAYWAKATGPVRSLISGAGYAPPASPPEAAPSPPSHGTSGGFWHDVVHEADNVRHAGASFSKGTVEGAGQVASAGTSQVAHAFRTVFEAEDEARQSFGNAPGANHNLLKYVEALGTPENYVDAWKATKNGASSFDPVVVRALESKLPPDQFGWAKVVAAGGNLQTQLAALPADQRAAAYQMIEKPDSAFSNVVKALSDAHLTPGEAFFGSGTPFKSPTNTTGNIDPTVQGVHPLSGLADGIVDWYDSPLIIGSEIHSASTLSRFALLDSLGNARDVRSLYQTDTAVRRGMQSISDALTGGGSRSIEDGPDIAGLLHTPGFNTMNPLAEQLVEAYPDILEAAQKGGSAGGAAVAEFFAGDQALMALAEGKAGLFYHASTLFPHVTAPAAARSYLLKGLDDILHGNGAKNLDVDTQSVRQMYRTLFGDTAEREAVAATPQLPGPAARFMRRATTLTPIKDYVDLTDPERASVIQRWADIALPPKVAGEFVNYFMTIPTTEQGRARLALQGLQRELFSAMNIDQTAAGRQYIDEWFQRQNNLENGERYSFGNNARYAEAGNDMQDSGREHAILMAQRSTAISMPKPIDLFRLAKESWLADALGNTGVDLAKVSRVRDVRMAGRLLTASKMDNLMKWWKASILFRPGFGVRIAGEEVFGAGLRNGFKHVAQARVAASLLGVESPALDQMRMIPRVLKAMTGHLPGEALDSIQDMKITDVVRGPRGGITSRVSRDATPEEKMEALQAHVNGWTTMHILRKAGVAFVPKNVMDSTMWLALNGRLDGAYADSIDAIMQHGGIVNDEVGTAKAVSRWTGATGTLRMRPYGPLKQLANFDPVPAETYSYDLGALLHPLPQAAAGHFDEGYEKQFESVLDWMHDPANAKDVSSMDVSEMTKDGRTVATGTASKEEALRDWADAVVQHVNNLVGPRASHQVQVTIDGETHGMADLIRDGIVPPTPSLEDIPSEEAPDVLVARQLVPVAPSIARGILDHGMTNMVGRPLNYLSRMPIFNMHFSTAFNETKQLLASRGIEDFGDHLAGDLAENRAYREVMPYIHNPAVRSQLSVITHNLAPFWFAQEQFYKRWAMTFAKYPEAYRKAQLVMNGLRSVGFIQKDEYGQDSFTYPGSGAVSTLLTHIFPKSSIPVLNQFTSEISQLNPSFATGGVISAPTVGPLVSIPMVTLNAYLPSLDPAVAAALGPEAPVDDHNLPIVEQIMLGAFQQGTPTIVQRIADVAAMSSNPDDPFYSSMKATATIQAAQYLEAEGYGPPATSDTYENDVWQNRVSAWATTIMALRAVFGFLAPGTPSVKISGSALGQQYDDLLAEMPYDQAVSAFLKANPDATAYTIAASTADNPGQSGAYIPETSGALQFIDQNKGFFQKYSAAAPWLFPLSSQQGVFADNAYLQELGVGLRTREDFNQWYSSVRVAQGSNLYFAMDDKVKADLADNPNDKSGIDNWWDQWKDAFKAANPLFATWLDEDPSQPRRQEVITQMQSALKDDALPKTTMSQQMALLMNGYEQLSDFYDSAQGMSQYATQYIENKNAYIAYGNEFAKLYPGVSAFWTSVLRPEIMENYGNDSDV